MILITTSPALFSSLLINILINHIKRLYQGSYYKSANQKLHSQPRNTNNNNDKCNLCSLTREITVSVYALKKKQQRKLLSKLMYLDLLFHVITMRYAIQVACHRNDNYIEISAVRQIWSCVCEADTRVFKTIRKRARCVTRLHVQSRINYSLR